MREERPSRPLCSAWERKAPRAGRSIRIGSPSSRAATVHRLILLRAAASCTNAAAAAGLSDESLVWTARRRARNRRRGAGARKGESIISLQQYYELLVAVSSSRTVTPQGSADGSPWFIRVRGRAIRKSGDSAGEVELLGRAREEEKGAEQLIVIQARGQLRVVKLLVVKLLVKLCLYKC